MKKKPVLRWEGKAWLMHQQAAPLLGEVWGPERGELMLLTRTLSKHGSNPCFCCVAQALGCAVVGRGLLAARSGCQNPAAPVRRGSASCLCGAGAGGSALGLAPGSGCSPRTWLPPALSCGSRAARAVPSRAGSSVPRCSSFPRSSRRRRCSAARWGRAPRCCGQRGLGALCPTSLRCPKPRPGRGERGPAWLKVSGSGLEVRRAEGGWNFPFSCVCF